MLREIYPVRKVRVRKLYAGHTEEVMVLLSRQDDPMPDDILQCTQDDLFHCKLLQGFAQLPRKPPLLDHIIVSRVSVWPIRSALGPPLYDCCSMVVSLHTGVILSYQQYECSTKIKF